MSQGMTSARSEAEAANRPDPLWRLAIGGVSAMVLSTLVALPWLPEPIAVQWSFEGAVTNQMSKWLWLLITCGAWAFVVSSLIGLRGTPGWPRLLMIAIGGTVVAAHVTTLENNLGAQSGAGAEPLDLVVAFTLVLVGSVALWGAERLLDERRADPR